MPFIEIDSINQKGKDLIALHRLYHHSFDKRQKEDIYKKAAEAVRNNKAIMKAFMNSYEGAFRYELCQHAQFSSDIQVVKLLEEPVEKYLSSLGVSNFVLYPYRLVGYNKMSTLCVERRIGIKAKTLELENGLSAQEARDFFKNGHAAAYLSAIVIPMLKKEIGEEDGAVRILYSVARTRSYMENIKVQFLVAFGDVTDTEDPLKNNAKKMKLLDHFQQLRPVLF